MIFELAATNALNGKVGLFFFSMLTDMRRTLIAIPYNLSVPLVDSHLEKCTPFGGTSQRLFQEEESADPREDLPQLAEIPMIKKGYLSEG